MSDVIVDRPLSSNFFLRSSCFNLDDLFGPYLGLESSLGSHSTTQSHPDFFKILIPSFKIFSIFLASFNISENTTPSTESSSIGILFSSDNFVSIFPSLYFFAWRFNFF